MLRGLKDGVRLTDSLWWFIQQTAATKQGGFYEFKPMYVSVLPIPSAEAAERTAICALVQKCLEARGQGAGVAGWEAEINERVARLYGLTREEIKIVSASAEPRRDKEAR
ncbi:MAG: hypothetical protein ACLQU4_07760 [Limisphaerales bacterium]